MLFDLPADVRNLPEDEDDEEAIDDQVVDLEDVFVELGCLLVAHLVQVLVKLFYLVPKLTAPWLLSFHFSVNTFTALSQHILVNL